jgi:chondroitin 4-sulfotransferase 11
MILSPKYKCCFIHIPKSAGTSMRNVLKTNDQKFKVMAGHPTFSEIQSKHNLSNYFKFAFTRNPWDRLVSTFFYLKENNKNEKLLNEAREKISDYSFTSFVKGLHLEENQFDQKHFLHFRPQIHFLESLDNVDFVGRFENFQQDFNTVCDKIGMPQQQLPHYNKTNHKHYTEYYDDETRQIVAEIFAKDIEYFHYEFGK